VTTTTRDTTRITTCPNCGVKNRVRAAADGMPRCGNCRNPLVWIVDTSDADFGTVADEATIPVLVDIWAPWCGPCRMVSPALEQLATELAGRLKLVKVNADEAPEVSDRFGVRAIPTLVLMHHGRIIDKQIGAVPAHVLRSWLAERLPKGEQEPSRAKHPSGEDGQP